MSHGKDGFHGPIVYPESRCECSGLLLIWEQSLPVRSHEHLAAHCDRNNITCFEVYRWRGVFQWAEYGNVLLAIFSRYSLCPVIVSNHLPTHTKKQKQKKLALLSGNKFDLSLFYSNYRLIHWNPWQPMFQTIKRQKRPFKSVMVKVLTVPMGIQTRPSAAISSGWGPSPFEQVVSEFVP